LTTELAKGGGQFINPTEKSLTRRFDKNPQGLGKLNVVIIVEESFGAEFIGAYGDTRRLTPEFDQLAQQGMLFTQTWATGTRTVRGLEAITLSFPPIPSESVIKRPENENMANWGKIMQEYGYQSSFLYGGYGYFDNMNYFYAHNGFVVHDRNDINSPKFTNIWGVSDEDLFRHAILYYDQLQTQQIPFFSIVMTTSNHKPFTFPTGIPNVPPKGGGREAGIRYADYALGKFFSEVKHHDWFQNTLFVVVADHGARVYGKSEIPLYSYRIPLLFLSLKHITPTRVDRAISQIDIAPTVLGLLGLAYEAPFFGQNVLQLPSDQPSVLPFNHNYVVALMQDNELALLDLNQVAFREQYDPKDNSFTMLQTDRGQDSRINLAIAYYQIAFEQFKHHLYR
jgi:phosphoglycerol transferase MdoB-like AlkP superfamily enzyme